MSWRTCCKRRAPRSRRGCSVINPRGLKACFLEQLARRYHHQGAILIQDNASYHKHGDVWEWFKSNREWLEVHQLPPYSPELNPTQRLWQHTRKNGTHNRFFNDPDALLATLTRVFTEMQSYPQLIQSYLAPFC